MWIHSKGARREEVIQVLINKKNVVREMVEKKITYNNGTRPTGGENSRKLQGDPKHENYKTFGPG